MMKLWGFTQGVMIGRVASVISEGDPDEYENVVNKLWGEESMKKWEQDPRWHLVRRDMHEVMTRHKDVLEEWIGEYAGESYRLAFREAWSDLERELYPQPQGDQGDRE